ncbi:InlB B-repeat-containing protein [Hamadaea sp. NPDC051192]|uniref:InlB B-repeat-containing protein n=1 Tax=Hamadaea sp. NPDC051192 TaxID=3154940 RepID=UPI00341F3FCD
MGWQLGGARRTRWCPLFLTVLVVLLSLVPGLAAGIPASAAPAPVGDADTPGVWGVDTVTFVSAGKVLARVQVPDGGLCPRQPAPAAADGVFAGWFVDGVPFEFESTVVTGDLTVTARFADTWVVQFLAPQPPGAAGADSVLSTVEVTRGDPLGSVSPDVPDLGSSLVFTGKWYRADDPTQAPYDFDAPVTGNLTLRPLIARGFAVTFRTDGSLVEPVAVVAPKTEFTQADLAAVPVPTRIGYQFTDWYADRAATVPPTFPITTDTTLYAGWQGGPVDYHVSYWLERPNVVPDDYPAPVWTDGGGAPPDWGPGVGALSSAQLADRANFHFLIADTEQATAGSAVDGPTDKTTVPAAVVALIGAQVDPAGVQPDPLVFVDLTRSDQNVVVQGDGSTVVNVYFTRALWRLDFPLTTPGATGTNFRCTTATAPAGYDVSMTVGDELVYQTPSPQPADGRKLGTFSVRVKIGLDVHALDVSPVTLSDDGTVSLVKAVNAGTGLMDCVLRGWGPQSINVVVFQASQTGAGADSGGVNLTARTTRMTARWALSSSQHRTQLHPYTEMLDQSTPAGETVYDEDGAPISPLKVTRLYENNASTVLVDIPAGAQVFADAHARWLWAQTGDRQVAGVIDGFTSYVGYGDSPGNIGNYSQYNTTLERFYQLNDSGNTNLTHRFNFYRRNAYDLHFDTGGGTAIAPVTGIRYEASLAGTQPPDPTRGDDVFLGWYTDSAFAESFDFATAQMPPSNLVLFAKWLVNPHTVRFFADPGDAEPIADLTQTVQDQALATQPTPLPPRPDGSTFLGWYQRTSAGFFVPYDFDAPVAGDLDLYARWKQPTGSPFPITYDGDGDTAGTVPIDPLRYNAGASAIVADGSALRRGPEVFVGWRASDQPRAGRRTEAGSVDGLYQAGQTIPIPGTAVTMIAAYADTTGTRTVTFAENAGARRQVSWDAVVGAKITYPGASDLTFTGPGTAFLGWSLNPVATEPDPAYARLTVGTIQGDLILYALWAAGPAPGPLPDTGLTGLPVGGFAGLVLLGFAMLLMGVAAVWAARRSRRC